ncbi:hypothetical protein ENUP19_0043G0007 [Entamoeba nuttalli]|uniref:Uncharacterized protein n=1 Tax=Entamoeba nuttalli TaxID=412467 RepID=A0ABQ0DAF0_9EUKA
MSNNPINLDLLNKINTWYCNVIVNKNNLEEKELIEATLFEMYSTICQYIETNKNDPKVLSLLESLHNIILKEYFVHYSFMISYYAPCELNKINKEPNQAIKNYSKYLIFIEKVMCLSPKVNSAFYYLQSDIKQTIPSIVNALTLPYPELFNNTINLLLHFDPEDIPLPKTIIPLSIYLKSIFKNNEVKIIYSFIQHLLGSSLHKHPLLDALFGLDRKELITSRLDEFPIQFFIADINIIELNPLLLNLLQSPYQHYFIQILQLIHSPLFSTNPDHLLQFISTPFYFFVLSYFIQLKDAPFPSAIIECYKNQHENLIPVLLEEAIKQSGILAVKSILKVCALSNVVSDKTRHLCICKIALFMNKNKPFADEIRRYGEFFGMIEENMKKEHDTSSESFFMSLAALSGYDVLLISQHSRFKEFIIEALQKPTKGRITFLMMLNKTFEGRKLLKERTNEINNIRVLVQKSLIKNEEGKGLQLFLQSYDNLTNVNQL